MAKEGNGIVQDGVCLKPIFNHTFLIVVSIADFFVENKIMVEIKALVNLEDVHLAQAMNYLEAYNLEIGLLINFGAKSLQHKRVHNNKVLKQMSEP